MKPTLLVLAAGMGSRYGGLKQLDPVGPSGETILDYSVYDAIQAGFDKVVFVIRHDFEEAFRERAKSSFDGHIRVEYAFQDINDLPGGRKAPAERVMHTLLKNSFAFITLCLHLCSKITKKY